MTTLEDPPVVEIGTPRRRKEDRRLITGRTRWTDNLVLPGMLHLAMVRSPAAHACVDDIGKVVNPLIVEGQVHGGLVQGISQALFEEALFDESGTLVTGSFVDYLVPSAADIPTFTTDRTESPATTTSRCHARRTGCGLPSRTRRPATELRPRVRTSRTTPCRRTTSP